MRRRTLAIAGALLAITVACGVPGATGVQPVDRDDVPFGLADTTTTSTTSTTLPPTTTTTIVEAPTTTLADTTTTIPIELVDIYFVAGSQLQGIETPLAAPPSLPQVLAALIEGPPAGSLGTGLRTILPPGAGIDVVRENGVATVDLPTGIFEGITPNDQRLVFGQIVFTLSGRPNVGQVRFTENGEPMRVFLGDGNSTEPGEAVSIEDYTQLLTGSTPPVTPVETTNPDPTTTG